MARSSRLESGFQDELIKELQELFKGCLVFKMEQWQGLPDLLILFNDRWASLETKKGPKASHRPNQNYYVDLMNRMSFSRFIDRSNKEEVLHDLQTALRGKRR